MCFSFHPLLVGGNPFDTTSIYAMIHYLEREWGVHYAMGGTGAIVQAFEKLITEQGGKFHLDTSGRDSCKKQKSCGCTSSKWRKVRCRYCCF